MLPVKCATSHMSMSRRMPKLKGISKIAPWCFCIPALHSSWAMLIESQPPVPFELGVVAYIGYAWHTSERVQILEVPAHRPIRIEQFRNLLYWNEDDKVPHRKRREPVGIKIECDTICRIGKRSLLA